MLRKFEAKKDEPVESGTVHVALLDGDGAVIIHEEIPAAAAPHRHYMLCLTAELDARDGHDRQVHRGAEWPPEGHEMKQGKVVPVAAVEA